MNSTMNFNQKTTKAIDHALYDWIFCRRPSE